MGDKIGGEVFGRVGGEEAGMDIGEPVDLFLDCLADLGIAMAEARRPRRRRRHPCSACPLASVTQIPRARDGDRRRRPDTAVEHMAVVAHGAAPRAVALA